MRCARSFISSTLLLAVMHRADAQDRGAAWLHANVHGLTVTPRVLIIGARPTDADAGLVSWLVRGHHVQTGVLSLTRGESSSNYTGLESGATLGAVHVQELLAARRIDGGEQYFTRAYDAGATRNAAESFARWDHATLLGDMVAVVRAFRPQVIVSRWTPDTLAGDGQQQASALLARELFDAAADTIRFPRAAFGMPWSPSSLFEPGPGVTVNAGAYDPLLGRTYADLGVESRAQLRSFGFETAPCDAPAVSRWRRIATRTADSAGAGATSLFLGIDTTIRRATPRRRSPTPGACRSGSIWTLPSTSSCAAPATPCWPPQESPGRLRRIASSWPAATPRRWQLRCSTTATRRYASTT